MEPKNTPTHDTFPPAHIHALQSYYSLASMSGKNRWLVADEPLELEI